jgi:hypothetical protein
MELAGDGAGLKLKTSPGKSSRRERPRIAQEKSAAADALLG